MSSTSQSLGIRNTLHGKQLLITGATGFLGLALVYCLLRQVPDCRLVLLIRSPDSDQATARFRTLIAGDPLFCSLPLSALTRVRCIAGDLTLPGLGLAAADHAALKGRVDLCINSAASVDFDEPLDTALRINVDGPLALQALARELGAGLLHISTAYVCGQREGLIPDVLDVAAVPNAEGSVSLALLELRSQAQRLQTELGGDGAASRRLQHAMMQAGRELANARGWPDIYSYTKFLAEQLLAQQAGGQLLGIFRPSIIESPYAGPCPGWLRGVKVMDAVLAAYGRGIIPGFPVDLDAPIDVIPVDMVAHGVVAQAAALLADRDHTQVALCQLGSSAANPLLLRQVAEYSFAHYKAHPLLDGRGRPVPVRMPRVPLLRNHVQWLERYQQWLALQQRVLEARPWQFFSATWRRRIAAKRKNLKRYLALARMFGSYVRSKRQFSITASADLMRRLDAEERTLFNFDPAVIDWRDYMLNRHLPGLDRWLGGNGR